MIGRQNVGVYLDDILRALQRIRQYTKKSKAQFFQEEIVQDAVVRQLAVIGEAAAKLPSSVKAGYPNIPWRLIIGMRNILIHDYTDTDLDTVWATVDEIFRSSKERSTTSARTLPLEAKASTIPQTYAPQSLPEVVGDRLGTA